MTNTIENDIEQKIKEAIRDNVDSLSLVGNFQQAEQLPKTLLQIPNLRHLCLTNFRTDLPVWLADLSSFESLEIEDEC
jgi:hypothetical protein